MPSLKFFLTFLMNFWFDTPLLPLLLPVSHKMKKLDAKRKQDTKKQPPIKYASTEHVLKVTEKFMKQYAEALKYLKDR